MSDGIMDVEKEEIFNARVSNLQAKIQEASLLIAMMNMPAWDLLCKKFSNRIDSLMDGDLMFAKDSHHVFDVRGEVRGLKNLINVRQAVQDEGEDAARQLAEILKTREDK